jgi:Phosphodiester glycosidase
VSLTWPAMTNDSPKSGAQDLRPRTGALINQRKWLRRVVAAVVLGIVVVFAGALLGGGSGCPDRRGPTATEIFEGITYGCEQLATSEEGSGFVYWVRVDLTAPGIELYVTPLDPAAVSQGWQYRLRRIGEVLDSEHLAVAINGSLFTSNSVFSWLRLPGDLANGVETVVADHVVSHVWQDTYLLWFDDQLNPYLEPSKPPMAAELAVAKWGIGGQAVWLHEGKIWPGSDRSPDSRTAVAIDPTRKLLFLAIGENISPRLILQKLADLGAKEGMQLDGGGSSSMAIGQGAKGVSPGIVYGGWRPVATHLGVRAQPLRGGK